MSAQIILSPSFLEFEWITSPEAVSLYIYLLLIANPHDNVIFGHQLFRGQLLTSRSRLMQELGISSQRLSTALKRLMASKYISIYKVRKYYIITLNRYDEYVAATK